MADWIDAEHFADKALASARGDRFAGKSCRMETRQRPPSSPAIFPRTADVGIRARFPKSGAAYVRPRPGTVRLLG